MPIDLRLWRAIEFERRAAVSSNKFSATVQEGRSGRSQLLGKPGGVDQDLFDGRQHDSCPARVGHQRRWILFAAMRRAPSETRYAMTSATSPGLAMWIRSGRSFTLRRTSSVTQPVSVTGG